MTGPRGPRRYLLLDLSGVLCRMDHDARLARLAAACDVDATAIHDAVWASGLDDEFDRGRFTGDEIYQLFRERFGFRASLAEFERAWVAGFVPDQDLLAVVDKLDPSVGAAILSDNGPVLRQAMPRLLPEFWRRFDQVLFSCDIKALKPNPVTFRYALGRLCCAPSDVLFFDDLAENVLAARSCGMNAELYVGAREAAAHIRRAGMFQESDVGSDVDG